MSQIFLVIVMFSNSKVNVFILPCLFSLLITKLLEYHYLWITFSHSPEAVIQMIYVKNEVVKLSKGVQKNMLEAWNFNKKEVQDRCLDNNFRTRILENATRYILSIIDLMVGL